MKIKLHRYPILYVNSRDLADWPVRTADCLRIYSDCTRRVRASGGTAISGELYRGRAIGGLNEAVGRSIVYIGDPTVDPAVPIRGLNAVGGWSQLKFRATPKLEFNAGFGIDNPFASDARAGAASQASLGPLLVKNLLFSGEYRHLQSFMLDAGGNSAQQVNLMMGILF